MRLSRKHLRAPVLALVLCLVPGVACACVTVGPELEIGPWHNFWPLAAFGSNHYYFNAEATDPDGCSHQQPDPCACMQFVVDWPPEAYSTSGESDCSTSGTVSWGGRAKFSANGVYDIDITATDDDGEGACATWRMEVFTMTLSMGGVTHIGVGDTATLSMTYEPSNLYAGYKELEVSAGGIGRIEVLEGGQTIIGGTDTKQRWSLPGPSTVTVRGASPGQATLYFGYTPDGQGWPGGQYNQYSLTVYVVNVEPLSVDATNPASTKVHYRATPADTSFPVTFTAPGTTQQAVVSDDFYFTFDQNNASPGTNMIHLTYGVCAHADVTLMKNYKQESGGPEVLSAYFMVEGVGWRLYNHSLTEAYYSHVYSIPYSGKTIKTHWSQASMFFGADYPNISLWTERHKYTWTGAESGWVTMGPADGMFPPQTAGRKCTDVGWYPPAGLKGISECVGLLYDYGGGGTPAVIVNAEVDSSMPE